MANLFAGYLSACGEPAISHDSHHVSLVQWTNLFASHHKGHRFKSPAGVLMWHRPVSIVSLHWWPRCDWSSTGLRPHQLSLGPRADNVTVPLDFTQLSCPVSRSLQVSLLASQPTESAAGGEPCGEPAISHDSHHVSLVQWTNLFASRCKGHRFKSPGGYLCGTGILLLAMSRYRQMFSWGIVCWHMNSRMNVCCRVGDREREDERLSDCWRIGCRVETAYAPV